jgi:hypothetical protein
MKSVADKYKSIIKFNKHSYEKEFYPYIHLWAPEQTVQYRLTKFCPKIA